MPTSTQTIRIDTRASAEAAFTRLSDVTALDAWLPRSPVYRGTAVPAGAVDRARYIDRTPIGELVGRIESVVPPERIEFSQATADRALSVRIVYVISPSSIGARIARTGTIATAGRLRWLHPVIVAVTHWENRRTMAHLRVALDAELDTLQNHHSPERTHREKEES